MILKNIIVTASICITRVLNLESQAQEDFGLVFKNFSS